MAFQNATVTQCVVRIDDPSRSYQLLGDRPLLSWILRELIRFGVTDFLLLADQVPQNVLTFLPRQVRVALASPPIGSGSGGALLHAADQVNDRFLLCDGNTLFDWNIANLLADGKADEAGVIARVVFSSTETASGFALLHQGIVDHLRPMCSLEADVLPELDRRGLLRVTPMDSRSRMVSGPAGDSAPFHRRALFLDRDGVLNIDHGYVGSRDRFEWVDGALEAIRHATESGWHVFVVTNQSGVARGLYTEASVNDLLNWMVDQARAAGGTIDDVRFCPFHIEADLDAYRQDHPWRKPQPGMLLDLIRAWQLDPQRAVMVGDQETDMRAAAAAGLAGHLFRGGNLLAFLRPILASV